MAAASSALEKNRTLSISPLNARSGLTASFPLARQVFAWQAKSERDMERETLKKLLTTEVTKRRVLPLSTRTTRQQQ